MDRLTFSTMVALCAFSCCLVCFSGVQCEVTSGSGGGYRRRLTQVTSGSSRASFSGTAPTALRASSSSSGGTSSVTAVAGGCRETASGSGAVSAACVGAGPASPASRTNGDDDDDEEEEESTIGLRDEDDTTYCTLCPTKNDCDVCCCFDGECVNRNAAERGTADCTEVKPARGKTVPSPLECERCREDDCDQYYHWCR